MKVFWMDTETSGTNPEKHGIIQIGYIIEIDYEKISEGSIFIDPGTYGKELDPEALKYNGITPEQIAEKSKPIIEIWEEINKVLGAEVDRFNPKDKYVIGGHNVEFDIDFLKGIWKHYQDKYFYSYFYAGATIDTKKLASWWSYTEGFSTPPASTKLMDIANALGVKEEGKEHDALFDITLTRQCALRMKGKTLYRLGEEEATQLIIEEKD